MFLNLPLALPITSLIDSIRPQRGIQFLFFPFYSQSLYLRYLLHTLLTGFCFCFHPPFHTSIPFLCTSPSFRLSRSPFLFVSSSALFLSVSTSFYSSSFFYYHAFLLPPKPCAFLSSLSPFHPLLLPSKFNSANPHFLSSPIHFATSLFT